MHEQDVTLSAPLVAVSHDNGIEDRSFRSGRQPRQRSASRKRTLSAAQAMLRRKAQRCPKRAETRRTLGRSAMFHHPALGNLRSSAGQPLRLLLLINNSRSVGFRVTTTRLTFNLTCEFDQVETWCVLLGGRVELCGVVRQIGAVV